MKYAIPIICVLTIVGNLILAGVVLQKHYGTPTPQSCEKVKQGEE